MSEWLSAWGYLLVPIALVLAIGLVLWRVWPVLMGTARKRDDDHDRLSRWNRYLLPLFRKTLEGKMIVVRAGFVGKGENRHTIATWTLEPSMLPDVEYIALARPGTSDEPEIQAVGEATVLRELLTGYVQSQTMFGHTAYIHVWPPEADIDAVVARLTPVQAFREQMGGDPLTES